MNTEPLLEIDAEQVRSAVEAGEVTLMLDCREPFEAEISQIEGSVLIPLGSLQSRVEELSQYRNERVVVYCHHGMRSLMAAKWLTAQGYARVQSMAGGIDAWSLGVDPKVQRY